MSTSLAWSSGRVSLLVHCSVPSAGDSRHPSSRKLSCNCTLPGFSSSVTPSILRSGSETGGKSTTVVSLSGGGDSTVEPHRRFVVPGYRRSALESVFSLVVALVMTVGVQGAPSSQDTFEDVPQTLSGGEKGHRIQKPKSGKAESCTRKCVPTCVRGGAGAPARALSMSKGVKTASLSFTSLHMRIDLLSGGYCNFSILCN
ncbi:hypothetical protein M758_7G099300 [Ceratodon purpureus]|nr:hypothetical protein M758_7G099300 [Ceratodon purpureus]